MTREELSELQDVVNKVYKSKHALYIKGDNFKCSYQNEKGAFVWTDLSGEQCMLDAESVLQRLNKGEHVEFFSYDCGLTLLRGD